MRNIITALAIVASAVCAADVVLYDLTMRLKVPRVYDNSQSLGCRKYQTQKLVGTVRVTTDCESEPKVEVLDLRNRTHLVGGACVSYDTTVDNVLWHAVGSNLTGKFNTASVTFSIDADPSYNVGDDEPDNTLILTLSGKGSRSLVCGMVAGQIGCGCYAYGHTSPTRIMWTGTVVDIASVYGNFKLRRK